MHRRSWRTRWNAVILALLGTGIRCCFAAPSITITGVSVEPTEVRRGDAFTLRASAQARDVKLGSFRLRTPYEVRRSELPPGFHLEGGNAVLKCDRGAILDNAEYDLDPADGAIAIEVSTAVWPEGIHYLVLFAHNRPGEGAHILDYCNIRMAVGADRVMLSVLDGTAAGAESAFQFTLPGPSLQPGARLVCGARLRHPEPGGLALRLRPPYTWSENESLPGFTYDAAAKVGYVEDGPDHLVRDNGPADADPEPSSIRVEIPTGNWPPGAHFLSLEVAASDPSRRPYGRPDVTYRDFFVDIASPADVLDVRVGPSTHLRNGTHFGSLLRLGNGRVLTGGMVSDDCGDTWRTVDRPMPNPNVLSDGTVLGMTYRALPVEDEPGVYAGQRWLSHDGGVTVEGPLPSRVVVPRARAALGHGPHVGPLFGRSIVELDNGDLIAGMYGWFEGDTEPDRYRQGGTMRRSYVCRSTDRGETWEYLSTVAYRPFLGNEGYSELVIRRTPGGDILALVRTGGNSNPGWQDNPLMVSRSSDGGETWSPVQRTGVEGVWPDLCVMSNGTLVCSTGRPGAFLMFSTDGGRRWTDVTPIDAARYSGYTAVCEVRPGELLVGYGARDWLDPATGERSDQLRLARVTVRDR